MTAITITIDGPVLGKGRPRFDPRNGHPHTPTPTRNYEATIRIAAQSAMRGAPLVDHPVAVKLLVTVEMSASWPAWKTEAASNGAMRPTAKPDIDNVAKLTLDALNGVVWRDDAQVVDMRIEKRFGDRPRLEIVVLPIDDALPSQVKRRPAA